MKTLLSLTFAALLAATLTACQTCHICGPGETMESLREKNAQWGRDQARFAENARAVAAMEAKEREAKRIAQRQSLSPQGQQIMAMFDAWAEYSVKMAGLEAEERMLNEQIRRRQAAANAPIDPELFKSGTQRQYERIQSQYAPPLIYSSPMQRRAPAPLLYSSPPLVYAPSPFYGGTSGSIIHSGNVDFITDNQGNNASVIHSGGVDFYSDNRGVTGSIIHSGGTSFYNFNGGR